MRKFWQKEWQNIQFSEFTKTHPLTLAGSDFYKKFYREFFKRYHHWEDLDPQWIKNKEQTADLIFKLVAEREKLNGNILSIGSGLGIIEKRLSELGIKKIDLTDTSGEAFQWIEKIIPSIYTGHIPECLPKGKLYDIIIMSNVDYVFNSSGFRDFLISIKSLLHPDGFLILNCTSLLGKEKFIQKLIREVKQNAALVLDLIGLYDLGQFWGYQRSRKEYFDVFARAGFAILKDGSNDETNSYYLVARINKKSNFTA